METRGMSKLRVGLVGCGHIAGIHVRASRGTGVSDVTDVFDVNTEGARAFAKRHEIENDHDTMESLIDAVDVGDDCSPPKVHVGVALETLMRGRDYHVEKAMVLSAAELDRVLEAQRTAGSKMCVIHKLKYSLGVQTARKWVDEGRIGKLL